MTRVRHVRRTDELTLRLWRDRLNPCNDRLKKSANLLWRQANFDLFILYLFLLTSALFLNPANPLWQQANFPLPLGSPLSGLYPPGGGGCGPLYG